MKTLLIVKSLSTQNTKKIADAISPILEGTILSPEKVDDESIQKYDLIGFGSGIYYCMHHRSLFRMLDRLKDAKGKNSFIFSTSGIGWLSMHNKLMKKVKLKGFSVIGEFSSKAFDEFGLLKLVGGLNKGRPNEDDLKKAKKFAEGIKEKIKDKR